MIRIYLMDFLEIFSRSGAPKVTKVKELKFRPDYEPAFDFYKPLRERIIETHSKGKPKKYLDAVVDAITDRKKLSNYPPIINGYKKWWGNRKFSWFEPVRAAYVSRGVEIVANPELGLELDDTKYLIKLYFRSEPLSKVKADFTANLMELALRDNCMEGEKMAVLDIRNARLIAPDIRSTIRPMVDAELSYISDLWTST